MNAFTFVHAADLHLDTPFEGLGRLAPEIAGHLRDSSLAAWDALVALCVEREARLLLLAGDIYDGVERGLRAQLRFLRGLERLSRHGVRVFVAHGNHDPHDGRWSAIREWPAGVTVFGHHAVQSHTVADPSGRAMAIVHGISHASPSVSENLALRFRRGPEGCPHFGVLHCNAIGDPNHPAYAPCTIDDLRGARLDYWALGHVHRHAVLCAGDPWIVYAGGTQGRSLKPGEVGLKGAVVGRVSAGRVAGIEFAPLPVVRFEEMEIDIAGLPDAAALVASLQARAGAIEDAGACAGLVVRATLVGRGSLRADLARPGALDDVRNVLREEAIDRRPFLWWSALVDTTRPDIDRPAIARRGDFSAELLAVSAALRENESGLAAFLAEDDRVLQAGALRPWTGCAPDDPLALLDEAESLALERLEERNGE